MMASVVPSLFYILLGVDAYAFWRELPWAHNGLAAVITSLLLLAIRNEWDLITWIAPRSEPVPDFEAHEPH